MIKQTIVIVTAACMLSGCYDLNYADRNGVIHSHGSYFAEEECEQAAMILMRASNDRAWCLPDGFETKQIK